MSITKTWTFNFTRSYVWSETLCSSNKPNYISGFSSSNVSRACTVITGQQVRHPFKVIAEGGNATTDMTVDATRLVKFSGHHAIKTGSGCRDITCRPSTSGTFGGVWYGFPYTPTLYTGSYDGISTTEADVKAREEFFKHALKLQRQVQSGVVLGELKKTLRMVRSPLRSLFQRVLRDIPRIKKSASRYSSRQKIARKKAAEDTYLESVFGWAPLMSDVTSGAEALAEYYLKRGQNYPYVLGKSGKFLAQVHASDYGASNLLPGRGIDAYQSAKIVTSEAEVKYYGKLRVDPFGSPLEFQRRLGFDPRNWLPTAWELVPYSFLVDYFTNFGDMINASAVQVTDLHWASRTVVRKFICTSLARHAPGYGERSPGLPCGATSKTLQDGVVVLERSSIVRTRDALSLVRYPYGIRFRLPNFGMKWLNIAFLASAKLSRPMW